MRRGAEEAPLLFLRPVAQLAEHSSPKRDVVGSIPAWPARDQRDAVSPNYGEM